MGCALKHDCLTLALCLAIQALLQSMHNNDCAATAEDGGKSGMGFKVQILDLKTVKLYMISQCTKNIKYNT